MNQRIILLGTILALLSLSVPLIINFPLGGTYYTQDIDPRILEVMDGTAISSNVDIFSIDVLDEKQGIIIAVGQNNDGFIQLDNPLPILQKIFPDKTIISFTVIVNDIEIPYTLEDEKLELNVENAKLISIVGLSEL